jgi:hypothetical protein
MEKNELIYYFIRTILSVEYEIVLYLASGETYLYQSFSSYISKNSFDG